MLLVQLFRLGAFAPTSAAGEEEIDPDMAINHYAAVFNGTNARLELGTTVNSTFAHNGAWSISFWLKGTTSSASAPIFFNRQQIAGGEYGIGMEGTGATSNVYLVNDYPSNCIAISFPTATHDGNWNHYVLTKSTSTAASGVKLYKNGVALTPTVSIDTLSATTVSARTFSIMGSTGTGSGFATGSVGSFQVFSIELSQAQVDALYNVGRSPDVTALSTYASCVAHLFMGSSTSDTITTVDDAIAANNGAWVGTARYTSDAP